MSPRIHILDQHSANQIAAGEVVERPVSVVKELVENSLDAGAKHIDITVEGNGVPLIQVRDDGLGISFTDLPTAVLRHATSKIEKIGDLDNLCTLGFRGEALPSIASVSHLEIITRPSEEIAGMSLILTGGQQVELKETGCPPGTSVLVKDLFYNTPARRKFLKTTNTEFGLISDTVTRLALARPDVAFSLAHPRQTVLQTSGRNQIKETIGTVLGYEVARRLLPISAQKGDWFLDGFISPPDLVRSSRQSVTFVVNGRIVRSAFLNRALEEGYHTLIPVKLHPVAVLYLKTLPADYDVNVHPTKMDIRFKNEKELADFITTEIRKVILKDSHLPRFSGVSTVQSGSFTPAKVNQSLKHHDKTGSAADLSLLSTESSFAGPGQWTDGVTRIISNADESITPTNIPKSKDVYVTGERLTVDSSANTLFIKEEVNTGQRNIKLDFWPLAQVFQTYILATDGLKLVIIDQHAAHERINYERIFKEAKKQSTMSQNLLIPLPMEFTLQEEQVLLEHLWALTEMGFVLEEFGPRTYLLRGVPAYLGPYQPDELLRQFIEEVLQKGKAPGYDQLLEEWVYLLACKESIKAKEELSLLEMEQLIAKLARTDNPYTCPHGRPTMIELTKAELEKRFYR